MVDYVVLFYLFIYGCSVVYYLNKEFNNKQQKREEEIWL